jgi:periplasmic protein TonB
LPDATINAIAPGGGPAASLPTVPPLSTSDVLPVTLAISIVLHAVVLLVTFVPPKFNASGFVPQLDVVLVNAKSASKPRKADALAQADLDGGGNTEEERRARTNLPRLQDMEPTEEVQLASRKVRQLEDEAQRLMLAARGEHPNGETTRPAPAVPREERVEDPAAARERLLVAQLEAQIAKEWDAYQKLPRRKFIGARTEGVVYAEYVDKWRQRIEKIGTEYYPEEARRRKLYGSLVMTVHIKADGSVEKVEIDRSSGHRLLDAAARRVVDLAGPFPPFPAAVRKDWDVLSISRTWMFTRNDLELVGIQ